MNDLTIRQIQTQLPWTVHYHRDFRASPMTHKDFGHALLHVVKATGKLSSVVNDAERGGNDFKPQDVDRFVADLVVCALRLANTCPGRTIDLQRVVQERIQQKNDAELLGIPQGENSGSAPAVAPANAVSGLAWSPTLDCGKVNHAAALKAVAKLNTENFQGHADWRLPEIRELLSLVDYTRCNPAIDTTAFPDTKSDWYWSSSSCAVVPGFAWIVHFDYGNAYWGHRLSVAFVRAVRGPSARASQ